jgi:hypothetical protein
MSTKLFVALLGLVGFGCGSPWKISGGPKECVSMCKGWGMELAGMVGVGDQSPSEGGATACVCELPGRQGAVSTGASGISAGSAAAIAAIQAEEQQRREQAQQDSAK